MKRNIVQRALEWLWSWLGTMPSTNVRIFNTINLVTLTAIRYLLSDIRLLGLGIEFGKWEPSPEWLGFLLLMAGIDGAQFLAKRKTHQPVPPSSPDVEDVAAQEGSAG